MFSFSGIWDFVENHSDALRLGYDAIGVTHAIQADNGPLFAASFTALVKDVASVAKIKEITPDMMVALRPHIEGMATVLMAAAAK